MEIEWLEDFLTLSSTLNFSKAASLRNLSQSTFSRRIQQLEIWLGVQLIDRSVYPAALTSEGCEFRRAADEIVHLLYRERDLIRGVSKPKRAFISFAMVQTIAASFFPAWLSSVETTLGPLRTTVTSGSIYDCFEALSSQSCDIMLSYDSRVSSVSPDERRYSAIKIADEYLVPVSAPSSARGPRHNLDSTDRRSIPYLGFSSHAYLARLVESVLQSQPEGPPLDLCYESPLAAALKAMAIAGRGVAWLPYSNVADELRANQLVLAGGARWVLPMEIRAYRLRDVISRQQIDQLWCYLSSTEPFPCTPPFAAATAGFEAQSKPTVPLRLRGKPRMPKVPR